MRQSRDVFEKKSGTIDKRELLAKLEKHSIAYHAAFPHMANHDLEITCQYCTGKTIAQITMECHCSRATVYRAIERVCRFVTSETVCNALDILYDYALKYSPNFGDCNAQSTLDMLYEAYREYNRFDDVKSQDGFKEIYRLLEDIPLREIDPLIYAVCDLCHAHQRTGFTEGIKLGIRLGEELRA